MTNSSVVGAPPLQHPTILTGGLVVVVEGWWAKRALAIPGSVVGVVAAVWDHTPTVEAERGCHSEAKATATT